MIVFFGLAICTYSFALEVPLSDFICFHRSASCVKTYIDSLLIHTMDTFNIIHHFGYNVLNAHIPNQRESLFLPYNMISRGLTEKKLVKLTACTSRAALRNATVRSHKN